MWIVTYERHNRYVLYKSALFESKWYALALIVYAWWALGYTFSSFPVKKVSLTWIVNGVVFMKGHRGMGQELAQLKRLKCKKFKPRLL